MSMHAGTNGRRVSLTALMLVLLGGCNTIGPSTIRSGRAMYNEAIGATNDQQLLAVIVKTRYGEPPSLLSVSSIAANVTVSGRVGADFGIGSNDNFAGNLVPLSAGVAYEENPTISYVPMQGEAYTRVLLSPIPIDLTLLMLLNSNASPGNLLTMLVRRINGIPNPDYLTEAEPQADARFARIAELMTELDYVGRLTWTERDEGKYVLILHGYEPMYRSQVHEFHTLLGLAMPESNSDVLEIPVSIGVGTDDAGIRLETRSIFRMISLVAAGMEVPEEDLISGVAGRAGEPGAMASLFRVRFSASEPESALVSYRRRTGWYYIDATDTTSKQMFRMLEVLTAARIADTVDHGKTMPVFTVPVSR